MATNVAQLPLLNVLCTVGTNEDWLDAFAFTTSLGAPLDLTGIGFNLTVSQNPGGVYYITGSLANGFLTTSGSPPSVLSIKIPAANRVLSAGPYYFGVSAVAESTVQLMTGTLVIRQS